MQQPPWLDPSVWVRDGRGRSSTFSAATDRISAAIKSVANDEGDSFSLVQCFRVTEAGASNSRFEFLSVDQLSLDGHWQYFIRSRALTPVLPVSEPRSGCGWPAVFACSGLVLLHHPDPGADSAAQPRSSLGIVHRVTNTETGDVLAHDAYDKLYQRLLSRLRRR